MDLLSEPRQGQFKQLVIEEPKVAFLFIQESYRGLGPRHDRCSSCGHRHGQSFYHNSPLEVLIVAALTDCTKLKDLLQALKDVHEDLFSNLFGKMDCPRLTEWLLSSSTLASLPTKQRAYLLAALADRPTLTLRIVGLGSTLDDETFGHFASALDPSALSAFERFQQRVQLITSSSTTKLNHPTDAKSPAAQESKDSDPSSAQSAAPTAQTSSSGMSDG